MTAKKTVLRNEEGTLALMDLDADLFTRPPVVLWNPEIPHISPFVLHTIQALQKWCQLWGHRPAGSS